MENSTIPKEIIENLLVGATLDNHLDNLHDIMIEWLSIDEGFRPTDVLGSTLNTYNSLRDLLKKLKPIEKENNLFLEKTRSSSVKKKLENIEKIDYKEKYTKALEEIKRLKEVNTRLKSLLN